MVDTSYNSPSYYISNYKYVPSNPYNSDIYGQLFGNFVNDIAQSVFSNNVGLSMGSSAVNFGSALLNQGTSLSNSPWVRGIGASTANTASILSNAAFAGELGLNIRNIKAAKDAAVAAKNAFNTFLTAAKTTDTLADMAKFNDATLKLKNADNLAKAAKGLSTTSKMNIAGLTLGVAGEGLNAAFGESKEYNGRYGGITRGMDMGYDVLRSALGFVPGGQLASGIMGMNDALGNAFGSTDGMSKTDAILGSSFMPFFVKWANVLGMKRTGTFNNQSWQNALLANAFMLDSYGNLGDIFQRARYEAGKNYGTFSRKLYNKALDRLVRANNAWDDILNMAHQNEYQTIRSTDMDSVNNQLYQQEINGGWNPIYRGKQGMKLLSNATSPKYGMRLLSGAAQLN